MINGSISSAATRCLFPAVASARAALRIAACDGLPLSALHGLIPVDNRSRHDAAAFAQQEDDHLGQVVGSVDLAHGGGGVGLGEPVVIPPVAAALNGVFGFSGCPSDVEPVDADSIEPVGVSC